MRVLRSEGNPDNWVAAVTSEADAAKGTFYVYFPSWEAMLATVRQRLVDAAGVPIRSALARSEPLEPWAVLADACSSFIDVVLEYGRHHALIFHGTAPTESMADPNSAERLLTALIERGVAEGSLGQVDVGAAPRLLLAAVHAAADAVLAGGERRRWIDACLALARGYLGPPVSARE